MLDTLLGVLQDDLMERLNLNLPEGARQRIRAIAEELERTESEIAREIVMDGLARLERIAMVARLREGQTAELHARKREIVLAMDRLRHGR